MSSMPRTGGRRPGSTSSRVTPKGTRTAGPSRQARRTGAAVTAQRPDRGGRSWQPPTRGQGFSPGHSVRSRGNR